jgi:hypothetical protein
MLHVQVRTWATAVAALTPIIPNVLCFWPFAIHVVCYCQIGPGAVELVMASINIITSNIGETAARNLRSNCCSHVHVIVHTELIRCNMDQQTGKAFGGIWQSAADCQLLLG